MQLTLLKKKPLVQSDLHSKNPWEQLVSTRNIDANFLKKRVLSDLHDPFLMPDMKIFCKRIQQAQDTKERVMIFGDYDVDGMSSTAALFLFLKEYMNISVSYRLPDRHQDGYGLKNYFIDEILATGTTLLVTVDCGIRDHDTIDYAREKGLDILLTDHHSV